MLSFRPWNQHCRGYDQIESPEFLMSRDVLRRNASRATRNDFIVTLDFIVSQFAFRMREEIRAIAMEREHDQGLCVQPRRRDILCSKALNRGGYRLAELH